VRPVLLKFLERRTAETELDGKLRTNLIDDVYAAVGVSQQKAVWNEMRETHLYQPSTHADSPCAHSCKAVRPSLGIGASRNMTVMLQGSAMAKQAKNKVSMSDVSTIMTQNVRLAWVKTQQTI
jgi:predicted Fe-S protein YdhL (DUF1289 family)